MTVRVQRRGPVTTVVLARPSAANAADRATALAPDDAFGALDAEGAARLVGGEGRHGAF